MDQDYSALINVSFRRASGNEGVLQEISSLPGVDAAHFFEQGSRAQVFSDGTRRIEDLAADIGKLQGVREAFAPSLYM